MVQVVQAKCPHCKNVLRIPADWISRPMKCKHCQKVFQAKTKTQPPAAKTPMAVAAGGVTAPTPLPPAALAFDSPTTSPGTTPARRRGRKSGLWKGALLFVVVLAIAGGVLIFAGPHLSGLFATKTKEQSDKSKVAQSGKKGKTDGGGETKFVPAPEKKAPSTTEGKVETKEPKADGKIEAKMEPMVVEAPKVVETPKKIDVPKKKPDVIAKKNTTPVSGGSGLFPRRALLINISNYLLFNPLHYGNGRETRYPGSNTAVLADALNRPPLNLPATQITELSDTGKNAFSTAKAVIETAISDFVDTSREQDRVIVLFTGHGIEIDKEAYLIPVEGDRQNAKSLIPLAWVYDKLAKCKARQKLLILDVFRFPPARGEELPGTGEMTEDFDAKLLNPPAGVQVWSSCIKGQQSIELEGGSVFMQALCSALQERLPGIQEPTNPLPLDVMVPKVNQRLKEILAPQKLEQLSRLTGTHVEEGGVAYNPNEPLPVKLALKNVTPAGGEGAGLAMVKNILEEVNHLPPVKSTQKQLQATSLPAFSAKVLEEYKADYKTWAELVDMAKDKEKYPLRAATLQAIKVMKESEALSMKESLTNPAGGAITPAIKKTFADNQKEPGVMIFQMESALAELKAANEMRDKETSKRWVANYDYALARLQSRLVYIYEYNNILAQVRGDNLPALEPIHNGWRVGSQKKVQISEPKVKDMVKNIAKTWKRIADENPGTPWAILASRESMTALGLVWRPSRD